MKDNFSENSDKYALFRPGYPNELFQFLKDLVAEKHRAWDCGTGNGQVASKLAGFMEEVFATDISEEQLRQALPGKNIRYSKQPAEKTSFPSEFFDLVTVGQAVHWFDFELFYREVKRVLKPSGVLAVMGYGLFKSNPETEKIIDYLYREILGPYWDPERQYLEDDYKSIPFPFREIETPEFSFSEVWTYERLIGYLKTWSAVKHYESATGNNAVDQVKGELKRTFGKESMVVFPTLLRLGKLH